jgi:hypothetical protein
MRNCDRFRNGKAVKTYLQVLEDESEMVTVPVCGNALRRRREGGEIRE